LACDAAYPKKFHLAVEKLPFSRRGIGALASVIAGVGNKSGDTMTITQYLAATALVALVLWAVLGLLIQES